MKRFLTSMIKWIGVLVFSGVLMVGFVGCSKRVEQQSEMSGVAKTGVARGVRKLNVVATTGIVADVVENIGGDKIELVTLIPPGADPHTFQPRPTDYSKMIDADVVFINGAGLEEFLNKSFKEIMKKAHIVSLSKGLKLKMSRSKKGEPNPHVWFSPLNIIVWAEKISDELKKLDPSNGSYYTENMKSYVSKLESLDSWIRKEVNTIPQDRRKLITGHYFMDYFADEYGFKVVGAIFKSHTTAAQPSAKDISALVDIIKKSSIKAIFVGKYSNKKVANEIARETGALVVPIYTGTLDKKGGEVCSYIDLMKYDVTMIVENLK